MSPDFASLDEREMLRAAAREERSAATGRVEVSFGDAEVVARRLAGAEPAARNRVTDAYRDFATRLQLLGITARELRPRRVSIGRLVLSAVVLFVAGSLVVAATLTHLPAALIVVIGMATQDILVEAAQIAWLFYMIAGLVTMVVVILTSAIPRPVPPAEPGANRRR